VQQKEGATGVCKAVPKPEGGTEGGKPPPASTAAAKETSLEGLRCEKCGEGGKIFKSLEALETHVRQKHEGAYKTEEMRPHWMQGGGGKRQRVGEPPPAGSEGRCEVCGLVYGPGLTEAQHGVEFALKKNGEEGGEAVEPHECGRCGKRFREIRSCRQHENDCKAKGGVVN
ncbi:hypothetical protein TrRE_jg9629, partial [Triparma retinervis]